MLTNKVSKLIPRRHWLKIAGITGVSMLATINKGFSTLINQKLSSGELKIVGGRYDLDTGEVKLIEG
jgi:hypothetical protein